MKKKLSRDRNGCHVPNEQSVLLELRSVDILNTFIIKYFWKIINSNSMSLQYQIQYIKVDISDKGIENILTLTSCKLNINCNKAYKRKK